MAKVETKNNSNLEEYKAFLTQLIQEEMVIIGPNIALDKAQGVEGLFLDDQGKVEKIQGDPYLIVKNLIDEYSVLSHPVTQNILCQLIVKFPHLKEEFDRAITKIELYCPIEL